MQRRFCERCGEPIIGDYYTYDDKDFCGKDDGQCLKEYLFDINYSKIEENYEYSEEEWLIHVAEVKEERRCGY